MGFTFFFRDRHTLAQLINKMEENIDISRPIKIWDAGCSNGAEPFTLAIMLAETLGEKAFTERVSIFASDVNTETGFDKQIQSGEYFFSLLSRMPEGMLEKYFTNAGHDDKYKIDDLILNKVTFVHHDLLTLKPFDSGFDVILCKNVLLHFYPDQRTEVVKMFHETLKPNGLYCTEQTQNLPPGTENLFTQVKPDAHVYIRN